MIATSYCDKCDREFELNELNDWQCRECRTEAQKLTKNEYTNAKRSIKGHIDTMKSNVISKLAKDEKKELKKYQEELMAKFSEEGNTIRNDRQLRDRQIQELIGMAQTLDTVEKPIIRYAHLVHLFGAISLQIHMNSDETVAIVRNLRLD